MFKTTASNAVVREQDTTNADVDVVVYVENLLIVVESGKISLLWVELKKKDTFLPLEQYQLNNLTKPGIKKIIKLRKYMYRFFVVFVVRWKFFSCGK